MQVLKEASSHVSERLYIHLDNFLLKENSERSIPLVYKSRLISTIYSTSPSLCPGVDIRVLMNGFKQMKEGTIHTKQNLSKILIDYVSSSSDLALLEKRYHRIINQENSYILLDKSANEFKLEESAEIQYCPDDKREKLYQHVVAGGTFDRIHPGHKILLSEALLRTLKKLTIGVADGQLLKRKVLKELMLPLSDRIQQLTDFLTDIDSCVEFNIVRIDDFMGPTAHDPTMEMIIVSEETKKGVPLINQHRKEKGLNELESYCIKLIEDSSKEHHKEEEEKFSSSSLRMRLLGTRLKKVEPNLNIPERPYVIGLTGGSASGKTNIGLRLQEMGAGVIDCDKLGHRAYEYGTPCYFKLIDTFGKKIVFENKQINRKALGAIVFNDKEKLRQLTDIVWPQIANLANEEIKNYFKDGKKVIVLDAAVLLEAKWERFCHEVCRLFIHYLFHFPNSEV